MLNTNYRAVVAAVLVGAALFSPLLCGMTCLEARGIRPSAAVEVVPPAEELGAELAVSAMIGCVLTHVVLNIDLSDWADVLNYGNWVWVGVEAVELVSAIHLGNVLGKMVVMSAIFGV